jgi:tRNA A-37 threonylcarbamoyl transferase component Bud32
MPSTILINPRYERLVRKHGLHDFERVMAWQGGYKVGKHAKRDVEQIEIEEDGQKVALFVKREWQTYLKDRIRNWVDGLGWGTKSRREWHVLRAMAEARVGCAEPVILAERSGFRPQAYLVLREIAGATLLNPFLARHRAGMTVCQRRQLAEHLGGEVARLHAAGIDHPDLFSKHILLNDYKAGELPQVWFIDMQRSSARRVVSRGQRVQDLASLDATVPPSLATRTDRLTFLHSYLRGSSTALSAARLVRAIGHRSRKLQTRRKIRAMREGGENPFHPLNTS